jgi:hypothetical protein
MKKVGSFTKDYTTRVKEITLADKTYHFRQPVELPAGAYNVFIDGVDIRFVKTADLLTEEDKRLLSNLFERSEHQ